MTEPHGRNPLYTERYLKVQDAMRREGLSAMLLTDPIQIRYATGLSLMPLWTAFNYCRYALVFAEHDPVIWEYPEAQRYALASWDDVRPCTYWQTRFAGESAPQQAAKMAGEIAETVLTKTGTIDCLGLDAIDVHGFQALAASQFKLVDADRVMQRARRIKTSLEIEEIYRTLAITETALKSFEEAIMPGVTENELLAVFWKGLLEKGGEWCYTRLVAAGARTNPWFQESSSNVVRSGDLVGIDTDVIGLEGYACDISRTFPCGGPMSARQRSTYDFARDYLSAIRALIKPGMTGPEIAARLPVVPEKYRAQRYPIFAHGLGVDDEPPFYPFADQITSAKSEDVLEENMVICIEFYAGEVGADHGVKLEDQLLVTRDGSITMNSYEFL